MYNIQLNIYGHLPSIISASQGRRKVKILGGAIASELESFGEGTGAGGATIGPLPPDPRFSRPCKQYSTLFQGLNFLLKSKKTYLFIRV